MSEKIPSTWSDVAVSLAKPVRRASDVACRHCADAVPISVAASTQGFCLRCARTQAPVIAEPAR